MKPIIHWNIRERRPTIIGWAAGIGAYISLNMAVYGSIRGQAQILNNVLQNLPVTARALISDSSDFLSPIGYLSSKLYYLMLPLLFTVLALSLSSHLMNREEQSGTLELLLSRPVSRGRLWLSKLLAALMIMLAVGTVTLVVTLAWSIQADLDVPLSRVVAAHLMSLLMGMLFGSIAWLAIGVGRWGRRSSIAIGGFMALASYLVTTLESLASWLEWPAKLTPYHYYQSSAILHGTYNWWHAAGLLAVTILLLVLGFLAFRRRDIG